MKTPEQWIAERTGGTPELFHAKDFIKAIQINTIESAISTCEKQYEDGDESNPEAGHANRGVGNCIDALKLMLK